jgi:hypothetical protein
MKSESPSPAPRIELDTRVRQSSRIATRTIEGQALIVQLDEQRLHTLNGVGTLVFELADGRSLAAIADEVIARYDVPPEVAHDDVRSFAATLLGLGALERVE